jgi:tryptophan-rich sensory protein
MNDPTPREPSIGTPLARTIASGAFLVPLALSLSSSPSPRHPLTLAWYASLRKPGFKPPDWAIPLAWSAIESGLAFSAYRLLRAAPSAARRRALAWWGWNVFMIGGWNRLFFKTRDLPLSTVAAASMVGSSLAFIKEARQVDRPAARAALPLVAWLTFATVLTATIWAKNHHRA